MAGASNTAIINTRPTLRIHSSSKRGIIAADDTDWAQIRLFSSLDFRKPRRSLLDDLPVRVHRDEIRAEFLVSLDKLQRLIQSHNDQSRCISIRGCGVACDDGRA